MKPHLVSAALACSVSLLSTAIGQQVVINEFLYDQVGPDTHEFIELYNGSGSPVDVTGWTLDIRTAGGLVASYVLAVPTGRLADDTHWTFGADAARPGAIDQVVGTVELWPDDTAAITLRDNSGAIVDTVLYEAIRGIFDPQLAEGAGVRADFISPAIVVSQPASSTGLSWQRCQDGVDTNDNARDFQPMPATPAETNQSSDRLPLNSVFTAPAGSTQNGFVGASAGFRVIDPTQVGPSVNGFNLNPNTIPRSPSGGNAGIVWMPSGGGSANYLSSRCETDVRMTGCLYLDAARTASGEGETWNIGFRGNVGTSAAHPDPSGTFYASMGRSFLPDHTGVAACWQRSAVSNSLWLIDYGDGTSLRVLGEIQIDPGRNDGWGRFLFEVVGDKARLTWGNESVEGTIVDHAIVNSGGVYFSYRGDLASRDTARPLTVDDMVILKTSPQVQIFGVAGDNSKMTPRADFHGVPSVGTTCKVIGMGVLPGQLWLAIGHGRDTPVRMQPGIFPPKVALYVDIHDFAETTATSIAFEGPLTIPNDPLLVGLSFAFHLIQFDPELPYPIPLTHTEAVGVTIGY